MGKYKKLKKLILNSPSITTAGKVAIEFYIKDIECKNLTGFKVGNFYQYSKHGCSFVVLCTNLNKREENFDTFSGIVIQTNSMTRPVGHYAINWDKDEFREVTLKENLVFNIK